MEQQYRTQVNEQLRNEMKNGKHFGFRKKMSSLFYHFYIIIFGKWFCREEHDRYVVAFEEFCKLDDELNKK